jgi:CRISPR system Cascade subunit CasC
MDGHLGQRTQRIGEAVAAHLAREGIAAERARAIARDVADAFGKLKPESDQDPLQTEQLVFVSPEERAAALAWADRLAGGESKKPEAADILRRADAAVDVAMFGRMLADDPDFNREAAVQVAHAITTHKCVAEDDYYTAVDDLKTAAEDAGAGFIGEAGFGAGVFYLYACVDRALLEKNLGGDAALAARGVDAFVRAAATSGPRGKQASFASRAVASYGLVEKGDATPRTLAAAFLRPVGTEEAGGDLVAASVARMTDWRARLKRAYGEANAVHELDVAAGTGTLAELAAFAADAG